MLPILSLQRSRKAETEVISITARTLRSRSRSPALPGTACRASVPAVQVSLVRNDSKTGVIFCILLVRPIPSALPLLPSISI